MFTFPRKGILLTCLALALFLAGGCKLVKESTPVSTTSSSLQSSPGILIGRVSRNTTEGGGTTTFTVSLRTEPGKNVIIVPTSSNVGEGVVTTTSLVISPANWNHEKTVSVTGVDDTAFDGDVLYSIVLNIDAQSDEAYKKIPAPSVLVINKDNEPFFQQEAYVKAANPSGSDQFGSGLAISGDTFVVGVLGEDSNQMTITNGPTASGNNSGTSSGAAYVYKRTGTSWSQEAYLKSANSDIGDNFGKDVAIAGDTIVVGADLEDSNQTTITNGTAASADNSTDDGGAVYVYKRTGTIWVQEAYLKPPNGDLDDFFGYNVDISGDTIVVGAPSEDSNQTTITNGTTASADNSATDAGAVYVFKRSGTTWTQEAYLKAANANANDAFGYRVAISGDTIVVGAPVEDSNQTTITNGTTASADNTADAAGAAYVYKRSGTTWTQEAYLKAANADSVDVFGWSVAISGDTIAVAAPLEQSNQTTVTNGTSASSNNSADNSGAVYVYKRTGTTWAQEAYLKAANANQEDTMGEMVGLSGDMIVVGAPQEDSNQASITNGPTASSDNSSSNSGAAYVYQRTGTTWAETGYLKASNSGSGDGFGIRVAVSGDLIVVGAYLEDSEQYFTTNGPTAASDNNATDSGAVYVFLKK